MIFSNHTLVPNVRLFLPWQIAAENSLIRQPVQSLGLLACLGNWHDFFGVRHPEKIASLARTIKIPFNINHSGSRFAAHSWDCKNTCHFVRNKKNIRNFPSGSFQILRQAFFIFYFLTHLKSIVMVHLSSWPSLWEKLVDLFLCLEICTRHFVERHLGKDIFYPAEEFDVDI